MSLEFKHIPVMSEDIDKILTPYKSGVYMTALLAEEALLERYYLKKIQK